MAQVPLTQYFHKLTMKFELYPVILDSTLLSVFCFQISPPRIPWIQLPCRIILSLCLFLLLAIEMGFSFVLACCLSLPESLFLCWKYILIIYIPMAKIKQNYYSYSTQYVKSYQ